MTDKSDSVLITETDPEKVLQQMNLVRYNRALARRNFIKNVGLAGVGMAAGALIEGCSAGSTPHAQGPSQADVLKLALNLEYLGAEFYSVTTTGNYLSLPMTGMATGGSKVTFTTQEIANVASEIATDETLHVEYLQQALGASAVAEPAINLAALGLGFANENQFLIPSRAFEDTGVSAYGGAATLLSGANLQAAAQILAVEAYHAGNIRLQIILKENGYLTPPIDPSSITPLDALDVVTL